MNFGQAISTCLRQYATFAGRASRPEFWWFFLFVWLVDTLVTIAYEPLGGVFWLVMLVPYLAVGTRRLRDTDHSPWWWLMLCVPVVGWIVLIVFWARLGKTPPTPT